VAERFKSKRVLFKKGEQKNFLIRVCKNLDISDQEIADKLGVHRRTFQDWCREKYSMTETALTQLSTISKIAVPKGVKFVGKYWYTSENGRKGALARMKKYGNVAGNPEYRKRKWKEWWLKEGRYLPHPIINVSTPIKTPRLSKKLAEFVGIMMGDGGMSEYQVHITLHREDDKEFIKYVVQLIDELFGIKPCVYTNHRDLGDNVVVSRRELVLFCRDKLGLHIGNKIRQGLDIPAWIYKKREYKIACVRGLIDTDGSVFTHRYRVSGKMYSYKKLSFTSMSPPLIISVLSILKSEGLNPRLARGKDIWLDSKADVARYFKTFGFSNLKHLKRLHK